MANATFPENNTSYNQTLANTQFTWFVNETEIATEAVYTETYSNSGGFIVSKISKDVNGCQNLIAFPVYVRVNTILIFLPKNLMEIQYFKRNLSIFDFTT